ESLAGVLAPRPYLARVAIELERLSYAIEQELITEGLLDEVDRAGLHRAHRHRYLGVSGDDDGRELDAAPRELGLEIESAHPRHAHVQDQAARLRRVVIREELRSRGVGAHGKPHRVEQPAQRVPHRAVVVDDEDNRLRRHRASLGPRAGRRGMRRPGAGSAKPTAVPRALRRWYGSPGVRARARRSWW